MASLLDYDEREFKKVSFRIRRQYFNLIKAGIKTVELRANTKFWRDRLLSFLLNPR